MLRVIAVWLGHVMVILLIVGFGISAVARDSGRDELRLTADGMEIIVFTYRPACSDPSILFVFHGLKRKAESVRNKATDIAEGACLMVFAPLFDKARFPNWRYHRAGVFRDDRVQPKSQYTSPVLQALVEHARRLVGNPNASLFLFGHSAGAQFLSRITAYTPIADVDRIVIANPSVHVAPLVSEPAPYGFGDFASGPQAQERIKAYLASPVTVYLGREDTKKKYLVNNDAAKRQGKNRLQRGRTMFRRAKNLARQNGWPFGWQLVEVAEVGHSSGGMLRAPALYQALGLPSPAASEHGPSQERS